MNCPKALSLFSEYYDGELSAADKNDVESHLAECTVCAAQYEEYQGLFEELHNLPQPDMPEGLHERLMSGLRRSTRQKQNSIRMWSWAGGAVAAGFIILSLFVTGISGLVESNQRKASTVIEMALVSTAGGELDGDISSYQVEMDEAHISEAAGTELYSETPSFQAPMDMAVMSEATGEVSPSSYQAETDTIVFGETPDTALYDEPESGYPDMSSISVANDSVANEGLGKEPGIAAANEKQAAYSGGLTAIDDSSTAAMLAAGYYEQHFEIDIQVDSLDKAIEAVNNLSGYSLNADINYNDYGGSAVFYRRVDINNFTYAQEVLRGLGVVTRETENVIKHADEVNDLEARLAAKDEEVSRLLALLSESRTIDVLTHVEYKLGMAENTRDGLRGRLNQLYGGCASPHLTIHIYEHYTEPLILEEKSFLERLEQQFIRSLNSFIRFMENTVILISAALIPLLLLAVVGVPVTVLIMRRRRHSK